LGAATLTWAAVRVSDKPADEEHPYGHGKFESLSALFGVALLFMTAIGVAREAILHLLEPGEAPIVTWYGIAVIVISMAIDFGRSRALSRAAKETGSHALEADALHFSTDILSSLVVLLGLVGVALGYPWADAVAALGVSFFIAHVGYDLGRRTLDVLVDAAPTGLNERVKTAVMSIPGIAKVDWVRARLAGTTIFIDLGINVSRTLPLEKVEELRLKTVLAVKNIIEDCQVLVIAEPSTLDDETITQTVVILAAARGLTVHSIEVATINERPHLSFHMEVNQSFTIAQAHAQAQSFEDALNQELGEELNIDIHIDPKQTYIFCGSPVTGPILGTIQESVSLVVSRFPVIKAYHHLVVQTREDGLYMSFHCLFPDDSSIFEVHEITERIEYSLIKAIAGLTTCVVHAEPLSHPETGHLLA
jgi:cation diffusion facilitator family transporter